MSYWLYIILLLFNYIKLICCDELLIKSKVGLIRGLQAKDGDYRMFLGIPYAVVNESNPFGESIPNPYFKTVFEAHDDSAMCPQEDEFTNEITGDLNCLHLNIYIPNMKDAPKDGLPVMVFIHGGYYRIGFSGRFMYGPKYLVRHGIILVMLNYRLGPYGFFCLDTPGVSGNQGFKDQKKALNWIYNNIAEFGGSPDRITLAGNSLGATSIDFILHSLDNERRIFDKAIISSNSYGPGAEISQPDSRDPLMLAEYLGYETNVSSNALAFIAKVNPKTVIEASLKLNLKYGLCLENANSNVNTFLTHNLSDLRKPKIQNMSIMVGNTNMEKLTKYNSNSPTYSEQYDPFKEFVQLFDLDENKSRKMEFILRHFYIGDEEINAKVKNDIIEFSNDAYFLHTAKKIMFKYIKNGAKDVFYYIFSYDGKRNLEKILHNITDKGVTHADDLGYSFDMHIFNKTPTSDDQLIIDRLTTFWANFVKYGNPTPETSELLPVIWKPYTMESQHYIDIDTEVTMRTRPFHWRMSFWDLLYRIFHNIVIKLT